MITLALTDSIIHDGLVRIENIMSTYMIEHCFRLGPTVGVHAYLSAYMIEHCSRPGQTVRVHVDLCVRIRI